MQLQRLAGAFTVFVVLCVNFMHSFAQTTVRPYKFGFTIDEQQHRSEQRDERGIVMGEFGFITADGIYHVTVYATDEEGRFRILAMRNYPYESSPKTIKMIVEPKKTPPTPITTTTASPKPVPTKHNFSNKACGGCFLTNNNEKPAVVEPTVKEAPKGAPPKKAPKKPLKVDIRTLARELPLEPETNDINSITGIGSGRKIVKDNLPKILNEIKQAQTIIQIPLMKETIANSIEHVKSKQISTNIPTIQKPKTKTTTTTITLTPTNTPKRILKGSSLNAIKPQEILTTTPSTSTHTHQTNIDIKNNNSVKEKTNDHVASNTSPGSSIINTAMPITAKTQTGSTGIPQTINTEKPSTQTNYGKLSTTTATYTNTNTNGQNPSTNLILPSATPSTGILTKSTGSATPKQQSSAINTNSNNAGSDTNVGGSTSTASGDTTTSGVSTTSGGGVTGSVANGVAGGAAGGVPRDVVSAIADGVKTITGEPGDLYRFKYILDYNGHTETGSRNGNKEGSYFSIGDDNIERTVEYVANENGYHPRIRWRKLDTPVKTKENTLKDYEFVWFKKE